jgi:hypothetical protein
MQGHYVDAGEPVLDVLLAEIHILTFRASEAGKILQIAPVGAVVGPNAHVVEITTVGTPTWEVFIAYRQADSPAHARGIGERLIARFGRGQVFKDVESLKPGQDFVDVIRDRLQEAAVTLVLIGPNWNRDRRIENPDDLHREEIRTSLERQLPIIPVLVSGAQMPRPDELPEDVRRLHRRQAVEIPDKRWDDGVRDLLAAVQGALEKSSRRLAFTAQSTAPLGSGPRWQWVTNNPKPDEGPGASHGQRIKG